MKILQVYKTYSPSGGGVERHIDGICSTLDTKFETTVIANSLSKEDFTKKRYSVIKLGFRNFIKEVINSNVIHLHGARNLLNLPFFIYGKILNKKIIYTPHCYYDSNSILEKLLKTIWDYTTEILFYYFCNRIILLNEFWVDYAKTKKFNITKVSIIPNCVKGANHKNIKLGVKNSKKEIDILSLSRIDKVKRVEDIINSVKGYPEKYNLHIVGDGPELNRLKKLCLDNKNIFFYGFIEDKKLSELLKKIDIFIIASEKEGMPTTIIEMLLMGIPVVASNIPGNISILGKESKENIFEVGDVKKIQEILDNKKFYLKEETINKIKKNFTWEKRIKEIENIYLNNL